MARALAAIALLGLACVACVHAADAPKKVSKSSEVKNMTDLVGLTDTELYNIFANPGPHPEQMPSQEKKDTWDLCAGLTLVNALSPGGFPTGPLPVGSAHIVNAVVNPVWQGKVFYTDSKTNQTWLWNVLFSNRTVELTANCAVLPHGHDGGDAPPSAWCDYSQTENPVGRIFRGEMRYIGNNVYLGRQFMTNPAFAYTPNALRDPITRQIRDIFISAFNQTLNAGLIASRLQGAGTGHELGTPQQVTWFTLQCGFPVTSKLVQTPGSRLSTDFLNELTQFWPAGYKPPVASDRGFENVRLTVPAFPALEPLPAPGMAASPFAAARNVRAQMG